MDLYKGYQESLPEKFNEKFILLRKEDNVLQYIDNICNALNVVNGVTYLGGELLTDESKFKDRGKEGDRWISIQESRLNLITIRFKIEVDDHEPEVIEKSFYVPKLVDDFYFIINSSKYFPILQIVDKSTYNNNNNAVVLKTLLMPIVIKYKNNIEVKDSNDKTYKGKSFYIQLFKHKTNILNYFLAEHGVSKTLELFGLKKKIIFMNNTSIDDSVKENYLVFSINKKISLLLKKKFYKEHEGKTFLKNFLVTLLELFNNRVVLDDLENIIYWKKKLGISFTKNTNNQIQKAEKILVSFARILDNGTKSYLKVDDKYKESIYSVIVWMLTNYEKLLKKDNFDLKNKRIRLYEYLLFPLLMRFSTSTYRILNSKTITFSSLKSIFSTLSPGFILKKLINNELLRYNNSSNTIDLFSSALRFTYRGPQSLSKSGSGISMKYRGLHPSYLSNISLTASSASDPGSSGILCPMTSIENLFFSDNIE